MQFAKVARRGAKIAGECWQLRYIPNQKTAARLGITVPKRFVPRAVQRNRLRRILRETFRQHWRATLPPVDVLLVPTHAVAPTDNPRTDCASLFAAISRS